MKLEGMRGVIIGQSGSGKTALAKGITYLLSGPRKPYGVVIDPFGYCADFLSGAGWHHQVVSQDDVSGGVRWYEYLQRVKRVVLEPVRMRSETQREMINGIAAALARLENAVLVIDEGRIGLPRYGAPEEAVLLYTQGRHGCIDIITVAQRAQDISIEATTQANFWAVFTLTYRDREYISQQLGIRESEIEGLAPYEFLAVFPRRGEVVRYPSTWLGRKDIPGLF